MGKPAKKSDRDQARLNAMATEAAYRDLFDNVNDIVYTRDLKGMILSINRAGTQVFHREAHELVGLTLHDLVNDPEVEASLHATNEKLLREGVDRSMVIFKDNSGQQRIFESNVSLMRDSHGRPIGARGIMRDVTESKRLEQQVHAKMTELEEVNERLKELDRIKATFAAMLIHDLKVPLSSILMVLETLDSQLKQKQILEPGPLLPSAMSSCHGVLSLVGEMLEIYRSESKAMELTRAPVDFEKILEAPFAEAQILAKRRSVALTYSIHGDLPLQVDPGKMRRVLTNLLNNAIKFTPAGGSVHLEAQTVQGTSVESGETFVQIIVTDSGDGIAAEDLPYVFDPYWQASRRRLDSGLGLAVVKRIVAAHGGNVSVRSKLGVGSEFTVILPTQQVVSSDPSLQVEPAQVR